ncbi:MAG: ABC transporter substrate-binding protein [Chloroflexota bacterium]|nr:ABC transporter substrate-binding protein [Chloroflexota bacterium]
MRTRRRIGIAVLFVFLLAGCAVIPLRGAQEPEEITIAMGFVPNVQFTPMYVAMERGYFTDEGINVTLDYGMETDLLQRVGTGDLRFAAASGDQVILARASDLPVTYFLNWYRHFPVCVVSMADKGITSPEDLAGKTVGIPATQGASYIGWLAFLEQVGISREDVNLQTIGYTQVASLIEDRVDAAVCYAMNEPVQLQADGHDINVFYLDDYTSLVSNGFITNEETIENDPELVRGVARAFLRGLQDTLDDPDAAFEITREAIPEMDDETAELQRAVLQECLDFWRAETLGKSSQEAWEESVDALTTFGLLTEDVEPETLYTNKFVD